MSRGRMVLVLHGHMPYVLHHGRWPHGESWLLEATLGVWLPLLGVVDELAKVGLTAPVTLGLTPILLEQLRDPHFVRRFDRYIEDRLERAVRDQSELLFAPLARYWEADLLKQRDIWRGLDQDIVGAFAAHGRAGRLELLSGFASHGYAALLKHDRCIAAQLRVGLACSERHLGYRPRGIWLPECSFRPTGAWTPPTGGPPVIRAGVDRILEDHGVTHFVVDSHMYHGARSEGVMHGGQFEKVGWDHVARDTARGWRNVLEPHLVGTHGGPSRVAAFARHPEASEPVWQADGGYPGDGRYLEFHRRKDGDGLRYWRVTDRRCDLGDKAMYEPTAVGPALHGQARHLLGIAEERLSAWEAESGRVGTLTAPFDAELFGHWWHEGTGFLKELLLASHFGFGPRLVTAESALKEAPPDKVAWLPEGSWGAGGDHRVWWNERTRWIWEALYAAEDRFLSMSWDLRNTNTTARGHLGEAGRALLLAQASDWPFVIQTGGAVDYGHRRVAGHLDAFERSCNLAYDAHHGLPAERELVAKEEAEASNTRVFPGLSLAAWEGEG
jgi:1,4-alpha-glucan branching enzyme